jgi:phospholipase/carboxylesterase
VPVFVAQGDADGVIPLDLQQRTWTYVRGDSGAETTSYRDGGGHGLTQGAVDALRGWPAERIA